MATAPPIFRLFSIAFGDAGGPPLPMRDVQSNQVIGLSPEWVFGRRSAPAAYPLGATPKLMVVFQSSNIDVFATGAYTIQASGGGMTVPPQTVTLDMEPPKILSAPLPFPLAAPLTGDIGSRSFTLKWAATDASGRTMSIGTSSHTLYVTWRPMVGVLAPFEPVVREAVKEAAGENTLEDISDSLLKAIGNLNLARSTTGGNVRMALLKKSTNSAGFAALLEQMLASQGIGAVTRAIDVDWDKVPTTGLEWVPTTTAQNTTGPGPQIHFVTVIPWEAGFLLCDADTLIGPVFVDVPLPGDIAWTLTGAAFKHVLKKYLNPAAKRRGGVVMPKPKEGDALVSPFTVHFKFPNSQAIRLKDVVTDMDIGVTPEWVAGMDSFPTDDGQDSNNNPAAAFVRGVLVTIEVTFLRILDLQDGGAATLTLTIGATGTAAGASEQSVKLTFDVNGRSDPHRFTLDRVVSNDVCATTLTLDWYVKTTSGTQEPMGTSIHPLYFTWQAMAPNPDNLPAWAYDTVVKWTCDFAAGATSDTDVCDRIFENLPRTGLKYGVAGWNPRQMILGEGGMCGGWYQLFQSMAFSQGVFVEKCAFLVSWQALPGSSDVQWNAIVVSSGGINQPTPPVRPTEFHDLATFPIPSPATLVKTKVPRYRFWGKPDGWADGHAINFLVSGGTLFLYDPSFSLGPIALTMALPPPETVLEGTALADFVSEYLVLAVSHMLGSFTVNGKAMKTVVPNGADLGVNGVSVVTRSIPTLVGGIATMRFKFI